MNAQASRGRRRLTCPYIARRVRHWHWPGEDGNYDRRYRPVLGGTFTGYEQAPAEPQVNTDGRVLEPGSRISAQGKRWTFSFRARILVL